MKKFRTLAIVLVTALGTLYNANAQRLDVGVQLVPSFPIGDFGEVFDFGFGGSIYGNYFLHDEFSLGLEFGFLNYNASMDLGILGSHDFNTTIIPIQAVGTYYTYLSDDLAVYVASGIGLFMLGGDAESTTEFGFTPRIGVSYTLSNNLSLSGGLTYMTILSEGSNLTALNLNLGVAYILFD